MFAYNPQVNDRSGEIMAAGQLQAAATNADSMMGLGQNISEALKSVGGSYQEAREKFDESQGIYAAMQNVSKIFPKLKSIMDGSENLPPSVQNAMARSAASMLGALSQFSVAEMNNQTRRQQQTLTAAMPTITAGAKADAEVAAGKAPYKPANRPRGIIPAATSQPMPVVTQTPAPDLRNIQRPFRNY